MRKKYKIQKIVYAENMGDVERIVSGGETSYIELMEDDKKNSTDIGFHKNHGE